MTGGMWNVLIATCLGALLFLVIGGALCVAGVRKKGLGAAKSEDMRDLYRNLGPALITGGFIAVGVIALQLFADQIDERGRQAREFQTDLLLTSDLSGFDPGDHDLAGEYLAHKTFNGAKFDGKDLTGTNFRDTQLARATFKNATLTDAELTHADFSEANLQGADLSGASLFSAIFWEATLSGVKSLEGAKVNRATCWPKDMGDLRHAGLAGVRGIVRPEDGDLMIFGHVCRHRRHFFTSEGLKWAPKRRQPATTAPPLDAALPVAQPPAAVASATPTPTATSGPSTTPTAP